MKDSMKCGRSPWAGLIAAGRAVVGKGNVADFEPLPAAKPGEMTLSEALEELRRDER